ncbi:putative WD repeat-containing protein [Ceratocystis lukuohia]|uniref:WD repeat-containing protein n=1 Tax=Ceratocystis lukuohia TaxID=2019550 RepID=A0ABR4MID8_9PEZI
MSDDDFEIETPDLAPDDPMRAFLPKSFGKQSKQANIAAQIDRSKRTTVAAEPKKPQTQALVGYGDSDSGGSSDDDDDGYGPQPQPQKPVTKSDDSDDDSDDDDDDDDDDDEFPVSHELVIKTHERAVTTVSLDPAGGRMITASMDCTIRLHDFASMTPTTIRAFRTVDPWESKAKSSTADSHPIYHVEFNPLSGGMFLVTSAHPQAKLLSRDGDIVTEFVKGDMYLRDMNNTTGHISEITTGTWHPTDRNLFVTAGTDSTLRIWDVNHRRKQKDIIVWKSKSAVQAGRIKMTAVTWAAPPSGGNSVLVTAALDGSLAVYNGSGPFWRASAEIRNAHAAGTWTSGVDVSSDGRMVVTRGGDNTIKLWDLRKFTKPLVETAHESASEAYPMSNIKYAPNSSAIITGSPSGNLHILNPANLKPELVTPVTPGSAVITVDWHPKINQIVTTSANAEVHVLYNPDMSARGAVEVMSRAPKKRHIDDDPSRTVDQAIGLSGDSIVNPNGILPGTRIPTGGGNKNSKHKDPRRPQMQTKTPFMKSQPDEKHISENIPLAKMLHEDPREALLKYAEVAKKDPMFTKAWNETQPETQYAELSDQEDNGNEEPQRKRLKQ